MESIGGLTVCDNGIRIKNKKFSKEVINKLKYYVYTYSDPVTNEIFYVGIGKGNRVFHLLIDIKNTEKGRYITFILDSGQDPKFEIITHVFVDSNKDHNEEA